MKDYTFFFLIFFIIVISIIGAIGSFYKYRSSLSEKLVKGYEIINHLHKLKANINNLAPAKDLPPQTQIFSQVNSFLQQYQINPISINEEKKGERDKSYQINIRLQSVPMNNLLSFFYELEFGGAVPLSIINISLRRSVTPQELYDVNMVVSLGN